MADWMKSGLRILALLAGISLLFAWFGVYDTGRIPLLPRIGLWFATMVVGFGAAHFIAPWLTTKLEGRAGAPVQVALIAALVSLPVTGLLMVISSDPFSWLKFCVQYGYVFVISVVVAGLSYGYDMLTEARETDMKRAPAQMFLERLPVKYRSATLYAVSAEDHYLRVHTSMGEDLILMRFADALRELSGAQGLQTHRSWWVAHEGVADTERKDGRLALVLKSGGTASVSRTHAAAVKAAGFS